jgi:hypothetical protein
MKLLSNQTATGAWFQWGGGDGDFDIVCSNWNGATATLVKLSADESTTVPVGDDTTRTANGNVAIFTLSPCKIRVEISGAVPAAGMYASANKIRS